MESSWKGGGQRFCDESLKIKDKASDGIPRLTNLITKKCDVIYERKYFKVHPLLHPVQEPRQLSHYGGTSPSISQEEKRNLKVH